MGIWETLRVIEESEHPMTAGEIKGRLSRQDDRTDILSVSTDLRKLEKRGYIRSISLGRSHGCNNNPALAWEPNPEPI